MKSKRRILSYIFIIAHLVVSPIHNSQAQDLTKKCSFLASNFVKDVEVELKMGKEETDKLVSAAPSLVKKGKAVKSQYDELLSIIQQNICVEGSLANIDKLWEIAGQNVVNEFEVKRKKLDFSVDDLLKDADDIIKKNQSTKQSSASKKSKKSSTKALTVNFSIKFTWSDAYKAWVCAPSNQSFCMTISQPGDSVKTRDWLFERTCKNWSKYLDFGPKTRVVITNEKSSILSTSTMRWSDTTVDTKIMNETEQYFNSDIEPCYLESKVKVLVSKFYNVKIGNENNYVISHQELKDNDFELILSKG